MIGPFAIDSSIARSVGLWRRIAALLVKLRDTGREQTELLIVPALVHAEMIFWLRRKHGHSFDPETVAAALRGVATVAPLDVDEAESCAARLACWHRTEDDWHVAKRAACAHCLGVEAAATGGRCPATVDWYVAAQAEARGWTMVVNDQGPEWKQLSNRIGGQQLLEQLQELDSQPS